MYIYMYIFKEQMYNFLLEVIQNRSVSHTLVLVMVALARKCTRLLPMNFLCLYGCG